MEPGRASAMLWLVFHFDGCQCPEQVMLSDDYHILYNGGIPHAVVSDAIVSLYRDNTRIGSAPPYLWELISDSPEPVYQPPPPLFASAPTPPMIIQPWEYTLDDRET
jgi:hypothetical protein